MNNYLKFNPDLFKTSNVLSICCRCGSEFNYTLPDQYCKICYYEYMNELVNEKEQYKPKVRNQKPYVKMTEQEEEAKALTYGDIKLIFGKYKNLSLSTISEDVKGIVYLRWLYEAMKKDETKKKSPTQQAIMKYIYHIIGV